MRPLVTTFALSLLAACAPQAFRAEAGAAFTRMEGDIGLQDSGGTLNLHNNMLDLHDATDVGNTEASPYVRLEADWDAHRFKVSGFSHNSAGSGVLTGDFGDLVAGTAVSTDMDFVNVSAAWSYDLMPTSMLRLAPGVQLGYYDLDVQTRATGLTAFESVDTSVLTPMPYIDAGVDIGIVSVMANAGLMSAHIRDATGRYWDAEGAVRVRASNHVELLGGFRYLLFDAHGTATGRDFDSDLVVFGWFFGGGVRF